MDGGLLGLVNRRLVASRAPGQWCSQKQQDTFGQTA
jgi:hypothetical protein